MLYYTGAIQNGAIQNNPNKSLGGYISSSQVPNDILNNLFSNIGYDTVKNNLKQIRVIAFLNTTGQNIDKLSVYTNSEIDSFAKLKIGLILNSFDGECNVPYFETLPNENATPLYVNLNECEGSVNAITIENIPSNQYVGVFIQRELIPENNEDFEGKNKSCQEFFDEFSLEKAAEENPNIIIPEKRTKDNFEIVFVTDDIETTLTVNAGGDQQISLPTTSTTLIGSATSDYPIISEQWVLQSGPNTPNMINANTFALTLQNLIIGSYVFRLTVKDTYNEKYDDATLTVLAMQNKIYFGYIDEKLYLSEQEIKSSANNELVDVGSDYVIPFQSISAPKYIWFAEPVSEQVKTKWQDTVFTLNQGNIGTDADLFDESLIRGDYRYYITNYATQFANAIQFKK